MPYKVFIDGREGTTGLQIVERLSGRNDIELLEINGNLRKDASERSRLINSSDFTFLCLPDDAAREAAAFVNNSRTRIIDASTAHRTSPDWAYGFPELSARHRERIKTSKRTAVPGCYATGFAALVYPLVENGIIPRSFPVFAYAVSGYSGGGKSVIAAYESEEKPAEFCSPRMYGLSMEHKHLPEMQAVAGLTHKPMFSPSICDFYSGMIVSVPIQLRQIKSEVTLNKIYETFAWHYNGAECVKVMPLMTANEQKSFFLASNTLSGSDDLEIFVFGDDEQVLLCSRFDNLGKGASGAAVQCFEIMSE